VIDRARSRVVRILPVRLRRAVRRRRGERIPTGGVRFGDFADTVPIGTRWGFDRGTPVDRRYIDAFLERHRSEIRGRVLEIADDTYARRFGSHVQQVDVLSAWEGSPTATIIADLANAPEIEDASFDCAIVTQTLQYIWEVRAAVATIHRILRPGGVALVSVPGINRLDRGPFPDQWHFTPASVTRLFGEAFGEGGVQVDVRGNVLTAVALLQGLAAEDLPARAFETDDPLYPVSIVVRALKAR